MLDKLFYGLDAFNNVISFILFLFSLVLVFRFLGYKYKKPLLYIFKKHSFFGMFTLTKIVIGFRKNLSIYTRMFCEYIIFSIKSDQKLTISKLNYLYSQFLQKYVKNNYDYFSYKTTFETEEFFYNEAILRYFKFYKKNKKKYEIDLEEPLSFILKLQVENGYLTPITCIPGLQDHYNDDWTSILNRYTNSLTQDQDSNELFMFYTWLMWGPSYVIDYRNRDGKLLQYGMGDESKSFSVVLNNNDKSIRFWNTIKEKLLTGSMGLFCSLTFNIYEQNEYFDIYSDMFNNETIPFLTKILSNNNPVILEYVDEYVPISTNETNTYFFSAYIWALFIKCEKDTKIEDFDITNCVSFFEHCNLADYNNYTFLVETLVNKIFLHFQKICSNSTTDEIYHLNFTFNKYVLNAIKNRYNKEIKKNTDLAKWLIEHLIFDEMLTMGSLLERFDEQFSPVDRPISIMEVNLDDKKSMSLLCEFYIGVYLENFQDQNERESLENFIQYLKNEKLLLNGQNHYHILIATVGNDIAGGIIGDYFYDINSGVFEFIVVDKAYRRNHIGARLIEEMTNIFNQDAIKHNKKKINYLFIETENPYLIKEEERDFALSRIEFWRKQRFKGIDFGYQQPSIDQGKKAVEHLILAVKILNNSLNESVVDSETLRKFLYDYAKYAMSIDEPLENETIQLNYKELDKEETEIKYLDIYLKDFLSKEKKES